MLMRSQTGWKLVAILASMTLVFLLPTSELLAQSGPSRAYPLRDYGHVFLAYAFAWLLILGWVLRIVLQLAGVEARLSAMEEEAGVDG